MPVTKQTPKNSKPKKGVMSRVSSIGDFDGNINILIYGMSGTGKTTLWSTFPGKILCVVCSGSSQPGELRSVNTKENRDKIDYIVLDKASEVQEIVEHQKATGEYSTIVLDHASGLQDFCLAHRLNLTKVPEQLSWGDATMQDWGAVGIQMKTILRSLLDLDCDTVIVAQERTFNNDSDSDVLVPTVAGAMSPGVIGWLNPACDYIVNTFLRSKMITKDVSVGGKTTQVSKKTGEIEYCLRTGPDATYKTKFRIPKGSELPDVIVDPDYAKIKELIG